MENWKIQKLEKIENMENWNVLETWKNGKLKNGNMENHKVPYGTMVPYGSLWYHMVHDPPPEVGRFSPCFDFSIFHVLFFHFQFSIFNFSNILQILF